MQWLKCLVWFVPYKLPVKTDNRLTGIACSIDMSFPPAAVEQGLQLLCSAVGMIESKPGCQTCSVARDAADAARIHYKETWESEALFRRHALSEEFRRILIAMDMCREEPDVVIGNFSGQGLTYLKQLCALPGAEACRQMEL